MKLPKLKTWHWLALVGVGIGGYFLATKKPAVASKPVDSPPPPPPTAPKKRPRPPRNLSDNTFGKWIYGIDTGSQSVIGGESDNAQSVWEH